MSEIFVCENYLKVAHSCRTALKGKTILIAAVKELLRDKKLERFEINIIDMGQLIIHKDYLR